MHVILWAFRVRRGHEQEFERAYGPRGVWAEFFKQSHGYMGTELLRGVGEQERYLTIDRWTSKAAYDTFREQHAGEYEAIDRRCEAMTESETQVGSFAPVSSPLPD